MKFGLILTNDYEVMGNGSGDVESILIDKTSEMLDTLKKWNYKHTIFFDVVEYWRFREAEDSGLFGKNYNAASLIENQIRYAAMDGHDVQLHACKDSGVDQLSNAVPPQLLLISPIGTLPPKASNTSRPKIQQTAEK